VVYFTSGGYSIWSSKSGGKGKAPYRLAMQTDGNLVIYDSVNSPVWNTNTFNQGTGPYSLIMQDDCNLVIYDTTNAALWSSKTSVPSPAVSVKRLKTSLAPDLGGSNVAMDSHNVQCPDQGVLTRWHYTRGGTTNQLQVEYFCITAPDFSLPTVQSTLPNDDGGGNAGTY
jgi:hypothetical protein